MKDNQLKSLLIHSLELRVFLLELENTLTKLKIVTHSSAEEKDLI